MVDNSNQDDKDLLKIDSDIDLHRTIAFFIVMLVAISYILLWFNNIKLNEALGSWGTFGDFIGGILNPIFACFAFYWLTYSVRLQIKELKDAHIELRAAAEAQADSAKHQETIATLEKTNVDTQKEILELQKQSLRSQIDANAAQQQQIALQNFESLFFELLKAKSDVTENITFGIKKNNFNPVNMLSDNETLTINGKNALAQHIEKFKESDFNWYDHYTKNLLPQFGSYFRLNYQILKLIHINSFLMGLDRVEGKEYSAKQKEYFDIFRATFNQYELEAHFFNCLSPYGNGKFKTLIEDYGFFEPLLIDGNTSSLIKHHLTRYAYKYESSIFEKNLHWAQYFKDINRIKLAVDGSDLETVVIHLINTSIINFSYAGLPERFQRPYQNHTYNLKFNKFIDEVNLENNLTISSIRKIKRNNDSAWIKSINLIKDCYNKISICKDRQNKIKDFFVYENEPIKESEKVTLLGFSGNYYSIESLELEILKHLTDIKSHKNNINKYNLIIKDLVSNDLTLTALILIKYGIVYSEFTEFMKNKNNPN